MRTLFLMVLGFSSAGLCQQPETAPPTQQQHGSVFKIGGGVSAPGLVQRVEPVYSEEARQDHIQGTVVLYVEIDPNGQAVNPRVVKSLGHGLDEKALEAVAQWKFRPGYKDGKPVTVAATIEVSFRLLDRPPTTLPDQTPSVNPDLHANVRRLVELSGAREQLQARMPQLMNDAKTKMQQQFPSFDPAFGEEWARRMTARLNADDFLEAFVKVYEKHFNNEEITEMIAARAAQQGAKTPQVSPGLQQKLTAEMPSILGEIAGSVTQFTVQLGAQIGGEIVKEHPEYLRREPADPAKQ